MTGVFFGGGDQSRLTKLFKTKDSEDVFRYLLTIRLLYWQSSERMSITTKP